jgi:hypothetical protein
MTLQTTPVVRQQIPNTHQRTNWEEVFSTQSVRQLRAETLELLEAVFSMRPVSRCYKQDKSDFSENPVWRLGRIFHRSPASRRRRRKANPVPGFITGPPSSWGI